MVAFYPLCAFGENRVRGVDRHAAARVPAVRPCRSPASRTGASPWRPAPTAGRSWRSSTRDTAGSIVWVPWQRPGFELGMMLRRAVEEHPGCDGILLGSHGLFTWGATQHDCYREQHQDDRSDGRVRRGSRARVGPAAVRRRQRDGDRRSRCDRGGRFCRTCAGAVSSNRRVIAHFDRSDDALTFANSRVGRRALRRWARAVPIISCGRASVRCSCPGIRSAKTSRRLRAADRRADRPLSRRLRARTTASCAQAGLAGAARLEPVGRRDSGARRLRFRQGQARSADHDGVLRQRRSRDGRRDGARRRAATPALDALQRSARRRSRRRSSRAFTTTSRCRGPKRSGSSAGRSKRRSCSGCRAEREFSRKIALVVGGGSGIGREVALLLAQRGAHVVVADQNAAQCRGDVGGRAAARRRRKWAWRRRSISRRATAIAAALRAHDPGVRRRRHRRSTRRRSTRRPIRPPTTRRRSGRGRCTSTSRGNYVLAEEAARSAEGPESARARWSSPARRTRSCRRAAARRYDVSKAAVNHLIRELAIGLGPLVRVNGIAPATVIAGSSMFPRDRVIVALRKYGIALRRTTSRPRRSGRSWRSSTPSGRSRAGRSCRRTAPTRSAGWPATRARRPPATSSPSTAGCRTRFCGRAVHACDTRAKLRTQIRRVRIELLVCIFCSAVAAEFRRDADFAVHHLLQRHARSRTRARRWSPCSSASVIRSSSGARQTCCGQMHYNTGYADDARAADGRTSCGCSTART